MSLQSRETDRECRADTGGRPVRYRLVCDGEGAQPGSALPETQDPFNPAHILCAELRRRHIEGLRSFRGRAAPTGHGLPCQELHDGKMSIGS